MRTLSLLTVLAVASLLLAGCAGAKPKSDPTPEPRASPPVVTSDTGAITGTVTDEELAPVQGAEVAVLGSDASGLTDSSGSFTLNGIAPGTRTLIVQKIGFESATKRVEVVAGEIDTVQIQLTAVAVQEPRSESIPFSGRFECSTAFFDVLWLECPGASTAFPDSTSTIHFEKPKGATVLVAELRWRAASGGTGQNLDFNLVGPAGHEDCQWYANVFGPSPLKIVYRVGEEFENPKSPGAVGDCGDKVVDDEDKKLGFDIYTSPTYVQDTATVGLTLGQPYEGYVTIFYDLEPSEGFSAFPDA